jgi:hypothetical protein
MWYDKALSKGRRGWCEAHGGNMFGNTVSSESLGSQALETETPPAHTPEQVDRAIEYFIKDLQAVSKSRLTVCLSIDHNVPGFHRITFGTVEGQRNAAGWINGATGEIFDTLSWSGVSTAHRIGSVFSDLGGMEAIKYSPKLKQRLGL